MAQRILKRIFGARGADIKLRDNFALVEEIDLAALGKLIYNYDKEAGMKERIGYARDEEYEIVEDYNHVKNMMCALYLAKKKSNVVKYRYSKKMNGGRLYSRSPSLQSLHRPIRHTIARDLYDDVDIKNAHPTLEMQYCKKNKIPCEALAEYIRNRDVHIKALMDECECSRDEAKRAFLTVMNGGQIKFDEPTEFLLDFAREQRAIRAEIVRLNPKLYETTVELKGKDHPNLDGSTVNRMLNVLENSVMQIALTVIEDEKVATLCFDGFMVRKGVATPELLRQMETKVASECGYIVEFAVKPMDEGIDLTGLPEPQSTSDIISIGRRVIETPTSYDCAEALTPLLKDDLMMIDGCDWVKYNAETGMWDFGLQSDDIIHLVASLLVRAVDKEIAAAFKDTKDKEIAKRCEVARKSCADSSFCRGVIYQLRSTLRADKSVVKTFDAKPELFAFSDGVVFDLTTFSTRRVTKDDRLTVSCGYAYNAAIEDDIREVQTILDTLTDAPDQLEAILSTIALSLYGHNRAAVFPIFTGSGGNGKGLLDTANREVFGNYAGTLDPRQLTSYDSDANKANSELAACRTARYVSVSEPCDEIGKGQPIKLQVATIKRLTGGDTITTRSLHKNTFEFIPQFTMYLLCNDIPNLSSKDGGIERRLRILEMPFEFKDNPRPNHPTERQADPMLKERVREPRFRNAYLHILLRTYQRNDGKPYISEAVRATTESFIDEQNPLKLWVAETYEIDPDRQCSPLAASDVYANYCALSMPAMTQNKFGRLLKEIAPSSRTSGGIKYYLIPK